MHPWTLLLTLQAQPGQRSTLTLALALDITLTLILHSVPCILNHPESYSLDLLQLVKYWGIQLTITHAVCHLGCHYEKKLSFHEFSIFLDMVLTR